ncbi:phage tail protein [Devosia neptuniae]|uniref:Phage tail protein n=1 Tax=Devosia neptuniae TaxID=191302 RepID=A0ABY6CLI1_9HYPH|nr:phage tail protein [Devosia neptuniae]UXN70888.1 phage tail protein [Devosia neptuniae]
MTWFRWPPRQWEAQTSRPPQDPLSIGVAFLVNIGWGGAISGIGATLVGSALIGAALLGASLLTAAFAPKPNTPQAQERQATVRQSVGPRWRFYGRVKVGGALWFFENKDGYLYSGITLNEGEISAIREIWLNDQLVTVDANSYVVEAPYHYTPSGSAGPGGGGSPTEQYVARVYFKTGTASQTVHAALDSAFPEVTADHRLRGVANCLAIFYEVPSDKIGEVYPQGNPGVRVVMDATLVKSVRTGARIFSDNPADCIYDYLTGVDGAGFPVGAGKLESQIDLASFQAFANLCDELVPLKAGGSDKRYRLAGGYALNEEMRTVLLRMCQACDADLYINGAGKMAIRGGKWVAPTLTLDSSLGHIISGDFRQGQSALAAFNELNITYVDPAQDYLDSEGERWLDESNIALRGRVLSEQLDLPMVPYHGQARRLAKIHTAKSNPLWVGTIVTNFYGLNALGEETVTIKFGPLGIDTSFLVQSVKILDDLSGVQLSVTSLGASAYSWDAATEEGSGPASPPDTSEPIALVPPEDFNVSAANLIIDGSPVGPYLPATWTEPSRTSLSQEVEYRVAGEPAWSNMAVTDGQGFAQSTVVTSGAAYQVRARTRSPGGVYSDYTDIVDITATPDISNPAAPTGVSGAGGAGTVTINATHSASSNSVGVRIYRGTTNVFGSSVLVQTEYGSPGVDFSVTRTETAGTRYYWVVAINGGSGSSSAVPTGAVVVT